MGSVNSVIEYPKGVRKGTNSHTRDVKEVLIRGTEQWPVYGFYEAVYRKKPRLYNARGNQVLFSGLADFSVKNVLLVWPGLPDVHSTGQVQLANDQGVEHVDWLNFLDYRYNYVADEWSLPGHENPVSMEIRHPWFSAELKYGKDRLIQTGIAVELSIPSDVLHVRVSHSASIQWEDELGGFRLTVFPKEVSHELYIRAYNLFVLGFHPVSVLAQLEKAKDLSFIWKSKDGWSYGKDRELRGI
ncbi:hypothetical protein LRY60_04970 [Candidatus Woesebacteria bacterium]|nr:hypothetical protein [Candidatus Woesebacteria bacterium]